MPTDTQIYAHNATLAFYIIRRLFLTNLKDKSCEDLRVFFFSRVFMPQKK